MGARFASAVIAVVMALGAPIGAGSAAADPDAPAPPSPGPPPGPPTTTLDQAGTFIVGTEILPGVYSSAGPLPDDACYWRRIGPEDITLENALSKLPQVVRIDVDDVAFKTNGCEPWQLTDAAPPDQNPPWLSQLQLRHSLDVLNGLAGRSGNGQLPPY